MAGQGRESGKRVHPDRISAGLGMAMCSVSRVARGRGRNREGSERGVGNSHRKWGRTDGPGRLAMDRYMMGLCGWK